MKSIIKFSAGLTIFVALVSCDKTKRKPNLQFMPDMYEPVGYETYGKSNIFPKDMVSQLPVKGSIARGEIPFHYPDNEEGYKKALLNLKSPIEASEENLEKGKNLYNIYCAICHGTKGDGQGELVKNEKFLGVPSYLDREITQGSIYHTVMYGFNLMGSHASQLTYKERWQVTLYVEALRNELIK